MFKITPITSFILLLSHSIDIGTVTHKNIRNMPAVSANQIADILHFNDIIDHKDRQVVLTAVDYSNLDTLFNQAKNVLKNFLVSSLNLIYQQMIVLLNMKPH